MRAMPERVVVTDREVQQVMAVAQEAMFGRLGFFWRFPLQDQERFWGRNARGDFTEERCPILVDPWPAPDHVGALREEGYAATRENLEGLTTGVVRPDGYLELPEIRLFAGPIILHGADPGRVLLHEAGHVTEPLLHPDFAPDQQVAPDEPEPREVHGEDCPFCNVDEEVAVVVMAMDSTAQRAHLQHRVPKGLGGRIPESQRRLARALQELDRAENVWPGQPGQVRQVREAIRDTYAALAQGELGPDDLDEVFRRAYRAHDLMVDYAHAYYLQVAS
jgi:hypothetical protein